MKPFRQRRHAHTRGWRSQDRIWYSAMFLDPVRDFGRAVYLSGNGFRVVGRIGIDDGSGQVVWQRRGVGSGEWSTIAPWRRLASRMDATDREPNAWAPLEGDVWSDLPPPITSVKAVAAPAPSRDDGVRFIGSDHDWPYPGLFLGTNVPATEPREAEARVLRGFRRMELEDDVSLGRRSTSLDLPANFVALMRKCDPEQHKDPQPGDVRAAWVPSPRDNNDWEYALGWWARQGEEDRALFRYRAWNPQWTFEQIGDRERCHPEVARLRYSRAVDRLFELARLPRRLWPA